MRVRFTDRARMVVRSANEEARSLNHEYIGTEHLLLGLANQEIGVAADVLKSVGIDRTTIRAQLEKLIQNGTGMVMFSRLPMTPRAKQTLKYAVAESQELNHGHVGTEHLLLGLIREDQGVAAQILMNLGLRLPQLRKEVLRLPKRNAGEIAESEIVGGSQDDSPIDPELIELEVTALPEEASRLTADVRRKYRAMTLRLLPHRFAKALLWSLPVAAVIGWYAQSWVLFWLPLTLIALQNVVQPLISDYRFLRRMGGR